MNSVTKMKNGKFVYNNGNLLDNQIKYVNHLKKKYKKYMLL
jgi:hypothetical protein